MTKAILFSAPPPRAPKKRRARPIYGAAGESKSAHSRDIVPAAQYVRMSTDFQRYSIGNQQAEIASYAEARGFDVIASYRDGGKSGLSLQSRKGLQALLSDVQSGTAMFKVILVYDVSRWGRFQDVDESAFYEFTCRRAGVNVIYCAERFENDGSMFSNFVKGMKREMAAEFSRELSRKVFAGQKRLVELGYHQGAQRGFGLRRTLVDHDGVRKGELKDGQLKSIQSDHIILTPGTREEIAIVRRIYRWVIEEQCSNPEMARRLNAMGCVADTGRPWTPELVRTILRNEKYIGNSVWARLSKKLSTPAIRNPPEKWIRKDGAFEAIVPIKTFKAAQRAIRARDGNLSDLEIFTRLAELLRKHGYLSAEMVLSSPGMPPISTFRYRYGGMLQAFDLMGYQSPRSRKYLELWPRTTRLRAEVIAQVVAGIQANGGSIKKLGKSKLFLINEQFTIAIQIIRARFYPCGSQYWRTNFHLGPIPDYRILVRATPGPRVDPIDYFILPQSTFKRPNISLMNKIPASLRPYWNTSLDTLYRMAQPLHAQESPS